MDPPIQTTMVKVSVVMVVYNHEPYLVQAVNSILAQETDCEYEIVIGEDCSKDGSRAMCQELAAAHPDRIQLLLNDHNLGPGKNFWKTLNACRGEYIAYLEGDDFWSDVNKMNVQTRFLDEHPEVQLCVHGIRVLVPNQKGACTEYTRPQGYYGLVDVLKTSIAHTSSYMFRRSLIASFPDWYHSMPVGDWPIQILAAEKGPIYNMPSSMSVYRDHGRGAWTGQRSVDQLNAILECLKVYDRHLTGRYRAEIRRAGVEHCLQYAHDLRAAGDFANAKQAVCRALRWSWPHVLRNDRAREAMVVMFPWLLQAKQLFRRLSSSRS